jgi:hypothetical protein
MKRILIPPMLIDLVNSALTSMEGATFDQLEACPYCGGEVKGHDVRKKRFACIIEDNKERNIHVFVKRFYCTSCSRLCYADAPFYPDTRLGSPLVDFCMLQSTTMPYHRVARLLEVMSIAVDRGTIRNYAGRNCEAVPYTELFGIRLPMSMINLSVSAVRGHEGSPVKGAEALAACGFPSANRAALHTRGSPEERDQGNKKECKEERKAKHP